MKKTKERRLKGIKWGVEEEEGEEDEEDEKEAEGKRR
jgi:hypothetical protein